MKLIEKGMYSRTSVLDEMIEEIKQTAITVKSIYCNNRNINKIINISINKSEDYNGVDKCRIYNLMIHQDDKIYYTECNILIGNEFIYKFDLKWEKEVENDETT